MTVPNQLMSHVHHNMY